MVRDKFKLINNFPLIIMVVVAIILIILVNIYLNMKPDTVISFNGNLVLSGDMTYNLTNKQLDGKDLNVEAVPIYNGDYIYKQLDSYYVGIKQKKEIDYSYPAYSNDGLTLYTINDDVNLINSKFEIFEGYSGISVNYGTLYNIGDEQAINNDNFIFLDLKNSIFVNTVSMSIKTQNNKYEIVVNSPIYFNTKYINYYTFDGKNFIYNTINDIYYDSIISIGDKTYTYEEFLLKMDLIKSVEFNDSDNKGTEDLEDLEENKNNNDEESANQVSYKKPYISVDSFKANAYYIKSNIKIDDPSGVIVDNPYFEIYDENEKLILKKQISNSGEFKIKGILPNNRYKIVGKYKYKNKFGITIEENFHDDSIETLGIENFDPIIIDSKPGERYSNKIEIKDVKISNYDNEILEGVTRVSIKLDKKEYNISYSKIRELLSGKAVTISTSSNLDSNTVYNYEIKFYDKVNNELNVSGLNKGTIKTSKAIPTVEIESDIKDSDVFVNLTTKNKDNINIHEYRYELYSYSGYLIKKGDLDYNNNKSIILNFYDLDYNTNYTLYIKGIYDLEDGKGNNELNYKFDFNIGSIGELNPFVDRNTIQNSSNTISADIYFKSIPALKREKTKIQIYLADKDGNDILNEDKSLKYLNEYSINELEESPLSNSYLKINTKFENLESNKEYRMKVRIIVKQIEKKLSIIENVNYTFETLKQDAYVTIRESDILSDTLNLSFKVEDKDDRITDKKIIIEIYDGKYNSIQDIDRKYVYREVRKIDDNIINLALDNFDSENYTVVILSNSYDSKKTRKELITFVVDKTLHTSLELFQQTKNKENINKMLTEINFSYYTENIGTRFYLIDCVEDSCSVIGTIIAEKDQNGQIINQFEKIDSVEITNEKNKMLMEYSSRKLDNRIKINYDIMNNEENSNHKFILAKKKEEPVDKLSLDNLSSYFYVLNDIEYNVDTEILNISNLEEFYKYVRTEKGNYVVTDNLDFFNKNKYEYTFKGVIDFQGYDINLYESATSCSKVFGKLYGTLKNFNLNYTVDYSGTLGEGYYFVINNYGNIENFTMNVTQINQNGSVAGLGLLSAQNHGIISNFAVYLNSDFNVHINSGFITWVNNEDGIIKNGYTAATMADNNIIVHDTGASFGMFTYANKGIVSNVYNLVDVLSDYDVSIGTIVPHNYATVKNTVSVATIKRKINNNNGPNVFNNYEKAKSINNYYYDRINLSFSNTYNKKINNITLSNPGVWEVILNNSEIIEEKKEFSIIPGYYPRVNMSNFMNNRQLKIPLSINYTESNIDIISTSVSDVSTEEGIKLKEQGDVLVDIYINNPENFEINNVEVDGLIFKEIVESTYNESTKMTKIKVRLGLYEDSTKTKCGKNLGEGIYAGDVYEINSLRYNNVDKKIYTIDKPRIEVLLYRPVCSYTSLINALEKNNNIFLTNNITYNKNNDEVFLPGSGIIYNARFDGNEKTIDLNNNVIDKRGYYLKNLENAEFKNVKITGFKVKTKEKNEYNYVGFFYKISKSNVENVDISDSSIEYEYYGERAAELGFLSGSVSDSTLNKISINHSDMVVNDNNKLTSDPSKYIYVGGITGVASGTDLINSYTYDVDITANANFPIGNKYVGGLVGNKGTIDSCYSHGTLKSNYYKTGGLVGYNPDKISNSYSSVKISSGSKAIGGLVGNSLSSSTIMQNNMFIGKINSSNSSANISVITPTTGIAEKATNYYYEQTSEGYAVTTSYKEFDELNAFSMNPGKLLYLNESSFVNQEIQNENINIITSLGSNYSVEPKTVEDLSAKLTTVQPLKLYEMEGNTQKYNKDSTLKITLESEPSNTSSFWIYTIEPNNRFTSSYSVEMCENSECDENNIYLEDINVDFYRKIYNVADWQSISNEYDENILLMNNIVLNTSENISNKRLNKVLTINELNSQNPNVSHITISLENDVYLTESLISILTDTMRYVDFVNFEIRYNSNATGIIKHNFANIDNCNFKDITIKPMDGISNTIGDYISIISFNRGIIEIINLENINVKGNAYIASLVSRDLQSSVGIQIHDITAKNITIEANGSNVGGLVASTESVKYIELGDLTIKNIKPSAILVGGIIGSGKVYNSDLTTYKLNKNIIETSCDYVGGISGEGISETVTVKNLQIKNYDDSIESSYVGGVMGYGFVNQASVENLIIANNNNSNELVKFNGKYVGGITSGAYGVRNSYVRNSKIYANSNVGGVMGYTPSGSNINPFYGNTISQTDIRAEEDNAGGLIGYYFAGNNSTPQVYNNVIMGKSNLIEAQNNAGGVIGYIKNDTMQMQTMSFKNNFVENYIINTKQEETSSGGLIGKLYKTPNPQNQSFDYSLFYGIISNLKQYGIGIIEYEDSISQIYKDDPSAYGVSLKSNFREYVSSKENPESQINNSNDLKNFTNNINDFNKNFILSDGYFPILSNYKFNGTNGNEDDRVELPNSNVQSSSQSLMMFSRRPSFAYNEPIDIKYDLYPSDVNKLNIEFSNTNENISFYYEIGNYLSYAIPVSNRTYTITYDFKNPIKIYLSNGYNIESKTYKSNDLSRKISIINGKTYYIKNNLLNSETSVINGNFVNLYGNQALSSDGKIYNIIDKKNISSLIDYNILSNEIALYEFNYNGKDIKTYYNYSTINGVIKEYQIFVKQNNLSVVNNSLENKKDSYIIDFYNDKEVQLMLSKDGKLYNLKEEIKYPSDMINNNIKDMYYDINSKDSLVALMYETGEIYTFNYKNGEKIFSNRYNEDMSFIDYLKEKINTKSAAKTINNITTLNEYKEIKKMKEKLKLTSVDDATNQISQNNSTTNSNNKYITMYNSITKKYDIYNVDELLLANEVESENDKIYKDYELVQFYQNFTTEKNNKSLNGILIFTLTVVSILTTLYLLIRRKRLGRLL